MISHWAIQIYIPNFISLNSARFSPIKWIITRARLTREFPSNRNHPFAVCVKSHVTYEVALVNNWAGNSSDILFLVDWAFLYVFLYAYTCKFVILMAYRWTGGAIGRPEVLTPDRAVLGPKRTCFCCVRCRSSICARSISKMIGAKRIVDELKTSHVAEHEYAYRPAKIYSHKRVIYLCVILDLCVSS